MKLTSGNLAVFSPVALTEEAKAKVAEMGGRLSYIVALDYEHHIFISEWAKAYPGVKIIGPEGLPEKRAKAKDEKIGNEKFDVVFTKDTKSQQRISEEFDADFDYEYVDGHANLELVFLYKPDKTVIQADLIFNLPAIEQYSRVPEAERPSGDGLVSKLFTYIQSTEGEAKGLKRFNWYVAAKNRKSFDESIKRINEWDFVTMIPCHGDVMEGNAKATFQRVFDWHLKA